MSAADTIAKPDALRIPTEAIGRARDFRGRVQQEDQAFIAILRVLLDLIRERQARHTNCKIRPEMLAQLARRWRTEPPQHFRLSFDVARHGAKGVIVERRIGICGFERLDPEWTGIEQGVAVVGVSLAADSTGAHKVSAALVAFSLHAIARRYQRGRGIDDDAIMSDMMRVAVIDPVKFPQGGGVKVPTDPDGGGWRGRVCRVKDEDGSDRRMLAIRTWMAE